MNEDYYKYAEAQGGYMEGKEIMVRDNEKTPAHVLSLAIEKGVAPEVLNKMLDVQERWEKGQAHKEFVIAMTAFKGSAPAVLKKASEVNFETSKGRTQYKYANLGDIVQEITSNLSNHALSASWETTQDDKDRIVVTCHITHVRGHRESVTLRGPSDISGNKNPIQAIGSAVTYLQRYTLLAALGLATAEQDDDGIATTPSMQKEKVDSSPAPSIPIITSLIDNVTKYDGKKNDKPYTVYTLHIGDQKITTFSETFAKTAKGFMTKKERAVIEYKVTEYGMELVSIVPVESKSQQGEGEGGG